MFSCFAVVRLGAGDVAVAIGSGGGIGSALCDELERTAAFGHVVRLGTDERRRRKR